ncbi:LLM class F420-dependent oxidoreductase [Actinomadura sp. WMMB 499]|uniref:LLM class F420-dependent oxidoreductase n=1 Tax=Actinomadura sp. WMMB 499 TaxID=1219491 RepID=UPI001245322A|nr:LLM class F420-dependent oxidoreductase [Actinomadura sp. WMMB 499]QFG22209.1 LLM class F420-dependent oxidoreductase [Actinomadura sp. WMMB 499]
MRIGTTLGYSGGFTQAAAELRDLEAAGVEIAFVAEAYSFDAVSQLGYLAAVTERMRLASAILSIYTRTPALLAMTAAGLDHVSGGRFVLGLGASGPQVIEGFHGVPYHAPIARTREIVEICRRVWRREAVVHRGRHYELPLPADRGTGLGKPLKLINHPVRPRVPIMLAAIGPKNVELAAEVAESWLPVFVHPGRLHEVWGPSLAAGRARRDPELGPLDVVVTMPLAIGDDVDHLLDLARPQLALYIGGMGARGKNFYNDLARRYGYEREAELIQELYLAGRKKEAEAAVPEDLLRATSLIGPEKYVAERIAELAECGVTTVSVKPLAGPLDERVAAIERLRDLMP